MYPKPLAMLPYRTYPEPVQIITRGYSNQTPPIHVPRCTDKPNQPSSASPVPIALKTPLVPQGHDRDVK
jgi:hypothetical protein